MTDTQSRVPLSGFFKGLLQDVETLLEVIVIYA